ncbi:nitronate monooxygenase [Gordonia jinhuaensis]|nr:nitronate monooxygenase [Gordonia jinhuaensis]
MTAPHFSFRDLALPVMGAPMAGGPSTPALAAAVSGAGGLGMLASAYQSAEALRENIIATRTAGAEIFGANLFVVNEFDVDTPALARYREHLADLAEPCGVSIAESATFDDDGYHAKLDVLVDAALAVVSFTFGLPGDEDIARLHGAGTAVGVTVTNHEDARSAAALGADFLVVQGPNAGGHRSTFDPRIEPPARPLPDLLADVAADVDLPVVVAGGLSDRADVDMMLSLGAHGVSMGTALLRTPEAGTKSAHRRALTDPAFTETVVTRAFSGRPARGLRNRFHDELGPIAPAAYPQVNTLAGPLKSWAAANDDPQLTNLWAGTGWRSATEAPAAEVITGLLG